MAKFLLLEHNADPNAGWENGTSALQEAALAGVARVVRLLLHGEDVEEEEEDDEKEEEEEEGEEACEEDEASATTTDADDEEASTDDDADADADALDLTIRYNRCRGGVDRGNPSLAAIESGGKNCLHWAANNGNLACVKMFLDEARLGPDWCCDINYQCTSDGKTALTKAVWYEQFSTIVFLLNWRPLDPKKSRFAPFNVAVQTKTGDTLLHNSVFRGFGAPYKGCVDLVKLLIGRGVPLDVCEFQRGLTPLMVAAETAESIEASDCTASYTSSDTSKAAMAYHKRRHARVLGGHTILRELLVYGAGVNARSTAEKAAEDDADNDNDNDDDEDEEVEEEGEEDAESGSNAAEENAVKSSSSSSSASAAGIDAEGKNEEDEDAANAEEETTEEEEEEEAAEDSDGEDEDDDDDSDQEDGPDEQAGDGKCGGQTALHLAASRLFLESVRVLLDAGIDADAVDDEGFTALARARQRRRWHGKSPKAAAVINLLKSETNIY